MYATSNEKSSNRPVHEVRMGRIRATVWENETTNGTRHNVTLCRLYKDGDVWKDSSSFSRDDLPPVAKVSDQVHSWIFSQTMAQSNGNENNGKENNSF